MNSKCVLAVLVLISLPLGTPAMSLKRHYRRPVCEPSQSCSYSYQQFTFELCDCPQAESCPMGNGVQLKGITYQFCGSRELPVCAPHEIAAEINNLQTSIYCVCPFEKIYVKQKELPINKVNVKYVCQEAQPENEWESRSVVTKMSITYSVTLERNVRGRTDMRSWKSYCWNQVLLSMRRQSQMPNLHAKRLQSPRYPERHLSIRLGDPPYPFFVSFQKPQKTMYTDNAYTALNSPDFFTRSA